MKQHSMISQSIKSLKALLALSALLITSPSFAQNSTDNHINNAKSATYDYATGQGLLTLESYVDGEIVEKPFANAVDLVMVLDVSNSMAPYNRAATKKETVGQMVYLFGGDKIDYLHTSSTAKYKTGNPTTVTHAYAETTTFNTNLLRYTIQFGGTGTMYNLAYLNGAWKYSTSNSTNSGTWTTYTANSANDKIYTDVKLDILENACRELVEVIYANPVTTGTGHRISIVTWASSGTPISNLGLTEATTGNKSTLINNLKELNTSYDTYACVGLDQAYANLDFSSSSTGREKIVLFFTDGEPNNKFSEVFASAKKLKDKGVKVFSVGLLANENAYANPYNGDISITTKEYLECVSSLYANPTISSSQLKPGTKNTDGVEYYHWSSTGSDLANTFIQMGNSFIGGAGIENLDPDHGVYLKDQINTEYCVLADNTDASKIKTYTAECAGKSGGVLTFKNRVEVTNLTVTVNTTSQSVDVEGFDYSGNWCGYDAKNKTYRGKKLIITIPFKMKAPGNGEFNVAFTNTEDSSLYDGKGPVNGAEFPIPDVKFTEVTIQKYGLKAGDSAVYIVKKGDVEITRVILTGTDDSGSMVSIKLRILEPDVEYSVTETWWDYTYTLTSKQVTDNVFIFNSAKTSGMENEAEHRKVNDFS